MKKRLWSVLLCLSLILALVPTAAGAADQDPLQPPDKSYALGSEAAGSGEDILLHKTAADNGDGTYTVTLTASAKEKVAVKPTEVVFLLDTSGSMNWCTRGGQQGCDHNDKGNTWCDHVVESQEKSRLTVAREAIATMVSDLSQNDNITTKFVRFGGKYEDGHWSYVAQEVTSYDGIQAIGGTPLKTGTEVALQKFTSGDDTNKVLIIIADGDSDQENGYPTDAVKQFQNQGGTVYTIGFTFSSGNFTSLASEGCSKNANNQKELNVALEQITTRVAGLISDPMGQGVDLVMNGENTVAVSGQGYENSRAWVSEDGRTIYWTNEAGLTEPVTLTYTVKRNGTGATEDGAYDVPLNQNATLNYHHDGKLVQAPFPIPVAHVAPVPEQVTLTYESNGGTAYDPEQYDLGTQAAVDKTPEKSGYTFRGWYADAAFTGDPITEITMDADHTVYARWEQEQPKQATLTYESNGGTAYDPEQYDLGTQAAVDKTPEKPGYTFQGWYADAAFTGDPITEITMDADHTVYARWEQDTTPDLNKGDHSAYIIGYPDETVRPQQNITRAEVATIFFRLLTDDSRNAHWASTNGYSDVADSDWFNNAVSTLTNMGILKGDGQGHFFPNQPITRAEFAAIAARFSTQSVEGTTSFSDVPGDFWGAKEITKAEKLGWIRGYPDGTFQPQKNITRAEAMTLVNRVLERAVDADGLHKDMVVWSDNPDTGIWPYYDVQEATNSHGYMRTAETAQGQSFKLEKWTKMQENRNWAELEKQWKAAHEAA